MICDKLWSIYPSRFNFVHNLLVSKLYHWYYKPVHFTGFISHFRGHTQWPKCPSRSLSKVQIRLIGRMCLWYIKVGFWTYYYRSGSTTKNDSRDGKNCRSVFTAWLTYTARVMVVAYFSLSPLWHGYTNDLHFESFCVFRKSSFYTREKFSTFDACLYPTKLFLLFWNFEYTAKEKRKQGLISDIFQIYLRALFQLAWR